MTIYPNLPTHYSYQIFDWRVLFMSLPQTISVTPQENKAAPILLSANIQSGWPDRMKALPCCWAVRQEQSERPTNGNVSASLPAWCLQVSPYFCWQTTMRHQHLPTNQINNQWSRVPPASLKVSYGAQLRLPTKSKVVYLLAEEGHLFGMYGVNNHQATATATTQM